MEQVALNDGRNGYTLPWVAQTPRPWREGYSRLFIEFTDAELKHGTGGKRGHIQIVRNTKFKRVDGAALARIGGAA